MTRRIRRIFLPCLIAATMITGGVFSPAAMAYETDYDSIIADDYEADLCGWTHDSLPMDAFEPENTCNFSFRRQATRTSVDFERSLATVATAACANVGVSVQQIVEPFAMVGPQIEKSLESVQHLQKWWGTATQRATDATPDDVMPDDVMPDDGHVPLVDFSGEIPSDQTWSTNYASDFESLDRLLRQQIAELSGEEPIDAIGDDVQAYGPSILVEEPAVEIAASPAVGSSAMIFTMAESYVPYDVAVRDLHAGGILSMSKRPFCIRARVELPEFDLAFDHPSAAVGVESADAQLAQSPSSAFDANESVDCVLDDWVWKATLALEDGGPVRKWVSGEMAGQQVAALVVKHNQVAQGIVDRLAAIYLQPGQPKPSAGALLLARAGAAESGAVESAEGSPAVDTQQLARAAANIRYWFSAVENSARTLSRHWLLRLAEVSPAPKDSGTTSRR